MRPNVDFSKKAKNSFIFFQLGLIATMLAVLFALEFNFELKPKKADVPKTISTVDISLPSNFKIISKSNPIAQNKPKTQPQFKSDFKATINEVPKDIVPIDVTPKDIDSNEPKNSAEDNPIETAPTAKSEPTAFNVEELPMFPACKGLSRDQQMKCFEEQMSKAVAKNLVYPQDDYDNGIQGKVKISFVIDENGKVVDVKAFDNKIITEEMKFAAERAVRKVPILIPAKQGGKPVKIKYVIPITFKIQ